MLLLIKIQSYLLETYTLRFINYYSVGYYYRELFTLGVILSSTTEDTTHTEDREHLTALVVYKCQRIVIKAFERYEEADRQFRTQIDGILQLDDVVEDSLTTINQSMLGLDVYKQHNTATNYEIKPSLKVLDVGSLRGFIVVRSEDQNYQVIRVSQSYIIHTAYVFISKEQVDRVFKAINLLV